MKKIVCGALFVPTMLLAQVTARQSTSAQVSTKAGASTQLSAEGSAKLQPIYAAARARGYATTAIDARVAEGEAKGASEAKIIAAAAKVQADMETSEEAMLSAGRPHPSSAECERGAMAMARGVTSAQIEVMAHHAPSDRSLVVAFDVLAKLAADGMPVTQALARVQAKLDARASDAALLTLATNGGATVGAGASAAGRAAGASGVNAAAAGSAGAVAKGAAGSVGATVGATVGGVVKKP